MLFQPDALTTAASKVRGEPTIKNNSEPVEKEEGERERKLLQEMLGCQ